MILLSLIPRQSHNQANTRVRNFTRCSYCLPTVLHQTNKKLPRTYLPPAESHTTRRIYNLTKVMHFQWVIAVMVPVLAVARPFPPATDVSSKLGDKDLMTQEGDETHVSSYLRGAKRGTGIGDVEERGFFDALDDLIVDGLSVEACGLTAEECVGQVQKLLEGPLPRVGR